ncbi:MAG: hypothetical protein AAFP08_07260 [Bacteroidota bacterium]
MKYYLLYLLIVPAIFLACGGDGHTNNGQTEVTTDPAVALIDEAIEAMGGMDAYRQLENVSYKYMRMGVEGPRLVSEEIYLYPSEDAYGRYPEARNPNTDTEERGELEQFYVDDAVRVLFNGEPVDNPQALESARFSRKTNFYWLNMFFKLRDPGLTYKLLEDRQLYGQNYQAVEVSFEDGIGDVKDIYLVYINPDTKLVDYFLFTVMAADRSEPIMMQVEYEEVGDIKWPVGRSSLPSNWAGELPEDATWPASVMISDLQINSEIDLSLFE